MHVYFMVSSISWTNVATFTSSVLDWQFSQFLLVYVLNSNVSSAYIGQFLSAAVGRNHSSIRMRHVDELKHSIISNQLRVGSNLNQAAAKATWSRMLLAD
eukprot:3360147-Amphidinium_carterae.2